MSDSTSMEPSAIDRAQQVAEEANDQPSPPPLKFAIVAGVNQEGNFVFDFQAQEDRDKNLMNLLALGRVVEDEVKKRFDKNRTSGDTLLLEVGRIVTTLNDKMDAVLNSIKKPDTQL